MNKFWYFRHILPFLWPKSVKEENKYHKFSLFIASHRWVHGKNRNPQFWRWTQNWRIEWNLTVVKSKTMKNNVWMSNAQLKLESYKILKHFTFFSKEEPYKMLCNFQIYYQERPYEQQCTFQSRQVSFCLFLFLEIWFVLQFCKYICKYIWIFFPISQIPFKPYCLPFQPFLSSLSIFIPEFEKVVE